MLSPLGMHAAAGSLSPLCTKEVAAWEDGESSTDSPESVLNQGKTGAGGVASGKPAQAAELDQLLLLEAAEEEVLLSEAESDPHGVVQAEELQHWTRLQPSSAPHRASTALCNTCALPGVLPLPHPCA